jgi:pilus assembly protein CpaF
MTASSAELVARVRSRVAAGGAAPTASVLAAAVRAEASVQGDEDLLSALSSVRAEIVGAGPLEALLADPDVTDVLVNGARDVWIDRGRGLERVAVRFSDDDAVRRLAQRLVSACGRRLDDAAPYADARLPDGTRVHAVLPPVSPDGPCLSLRVPPRRTFTLDELVAAGTMSTDLAALLERLVVERRAFVVTGGTGSGKTTLLAALLSLVPDRERVLLVEDSTELRPTHPHVVRLEARPANAEGAGAVSLQTLVRQAMRMRPDRLVVGEVRGAEVVDLLAALNSGHEGGCGTLHANRASAVPARLEALGVAAGLPRAAVHSQVAAALDAAIHLARDSTGVRRVTEVSAFEPGDDHLVRVRPVVVRRGDGWDVRDDAWPTRAR